MTTFEDLVIPALEIVLDDDLPEGLLTETVIAQAALMAGFTPDLLPCYYAD